MPRNRQHNDVTSSQAYTPTKPPVLSTAERDRRWTNVRALMRERGLEGLLVAGFRAREAYETSISADYNEGCVILPYDGDPVVITWAYLRVMRARWSAERGTKLWVDDYRVATSGDGVAEVIKEKRLAEASLGGVAVSSRCRRPALAGGWCMPKRSAKCCAMASASATQ